jgi:hypothetical protein
MTMEAREVPKKWGRGEQGLAGLKVVTTNKGSG